MKRVFLVLFLLLILPAASAMADTTLMVATDLHYITPVLVENPALLTRSVMHGDGKMPQYSDAWLDGLIAQTIANRPDALVLLGDLSYNGEVLSHRAISDRLALVTDAGIPVYVIPGNHDINNDYAFAFTNDGAEAIHSIPYFRWTKYYEMYGLKQAFSRDEGTYSYAVSLSDDLWLLMLDAGIYEPFAQAFGWVSPETLQWMESVLQQANDAGIQVITASHQGLFPHSSLLREGYVILNGEEVAGLLQSHQVQLNLSGHVHIQHMVLRETLYDVALSSFSLYPHQYAWVTVSDGGDITLAMQPLEATHVPEGLLEESMLFIWDASYEKALRALRSIDIPDDEKMHMAAFATTANIRYYAGFLHTIYDDIQGSDMLRQWETLAPDAFWTEYMHSMLEDEGRDMTRLTLP